MIELLAQWAVEPTLAIAEALEQRCDERVDGRTLAEWLAVGSSTSEARLTTALLAFGPAAIPGLLRAVATTAYYEPAILAKIAPAAPFVGRALLASTKTDGYTIDACIACLHAGGISRDQLVPSDYVAGANDWKMSCLLAQLGVAYLPEMLRFVARTKGMTHQKFLFELRGRISPLPAEIIPILEAVLARSENYGRSDAAWLAVTLGAHAAPMLPTLLRIVEADGGETRRAALTALGRLRVPSELGLALLEPMLEPALAVTGWQLDASSHLAALLEAISALDPPPLHLAAKLEDALRASTDNLRSKRLVAALAKIRPDRVEALLDEVTEITEYARRSLAISCLETDAIAMPMRVKWLTWLIDECADGEAIRLAGAVTDARLVAPLCRRLLAGGGSDAIVATLVRYDRAQLMHELVPIITSPEARIRRNGLDALFALDEGDAIAQFLGDDDPTLVQRATRWLTLHGGAQLLAHLGPP
jgi:hypothetical protein